MLPRPALSWRCCTGRQFSMRFSTVQPQRLEDAFDAACSAREIPGVALLAFNKKDNLSYSKAFGVGSLQEPLDQKRLDVDSTMYIASCTKLMTSIAAMQCVERGLVTLDEDVRPVLHELQDIDIIKKDGGHKDKLLTSKNVSPITLRQLLTHTSGFSYEFNEPIIQSWRRQQPESLRRSPTSLRGRFLHPLVFEPGSSWSYGPSTDWAGVLVERLSGFNLQDYMSQNIWKPLGITSMTFFLSTRPDMQSRVAHMTWRKLNDNPSEPPPPVVHAELQPILNPDIEDCLGGGGIFASPADYLKVLRALLLASDASASDASPVPPTQLLRRSTVDAMFTPQLNEPARKALQAVSEIPRLNLMMGGMPTTTRKDWGLGGLLVMDDLPSWRRRGTLTWGGTPNLTWWIDREAGLCGLYAGQLMPLGDEKSVEMTQLFEREMYARQT
ncbi:beta-lactamase/transpeptidase-like protein [Ustulina deusta]|nr:beta-lactamase/transpeptidase-like protein [Ustulina deusta]